VEGQERNTTQLEKIGAVIEWRWSLEEECGKEENRDRAQKKSVGRRRMKIGLRRREWEEGEWK